MTGDKLRRVRNKLKMTQVDLAKRLGISSQTVHRYETGKQNIPVKISLAVKKIVDMDKTN